MVLPVGGADRIPAGCASTGADSAITAAATINCFFTVLPPLVNPEVGVGAEKHRRPREVHPIRNAAADERKIGATGSQHTLSTVITEGLDRDDRILPRRHAKTATV